MLSAPITLVTIAITVLAYWLTSNNPRLKSRWVLWPPGVTRDHQYDRLLTYGFVHADFGHLFFNMFTLFFFGGVIERLFTERFGLAGFPLFYLVALVVSILPSYLQHRNDANYYSLGASGAISACLFAFVLIAPWEKIYLFGAIPVPAIIFAVLYVGYSIWMSRRGGDGVNHAAHLWGAAFGIAATLLAIPGIGNHFLLALQHPGAA